MEEPQEEPQTWSWPARLATGTGSSASSAPTQPQAPGPQQPDPGLSPDQLPDETSRSLAIRSSIITLAGAAISTAASFGLKLDETQSAALIGLITAVVATAVLVRAGRRHG